MRNTLTHYLWPIVAGALFAIIILQYTAINKTGHATAASSERPSDGYAEIVQRASPSVVNIYTSRRIARQRHPLMNDPLFQRFFEDQPTQNDISESLGSGVIVDAQGYILTNNHVIKNADQILVRLADGRQQLASVVGSDPETDLAVLKIDLQGLSVATFASAADLRVGDIVLAIGNPYGFRQTVTQGIVSATGRYGLQLNTYENYIQTDAATNPGNSGGALVNTDGALVGINTAIYSKSGGSHGIALAIPVDIARHVLHDLTHYGEVIRGWLGIQVQELTPTLAKRFGLTVHHGIILTKTVEGGPADLAGLKSGDIITHIAEIAVGSGNSGMHQVAMIRPGEKINLRIIREGAAQTFLVEVGKRQTNLSG